VGEELRAIYIHYLQSEMPDHDKIIIKDETQEQDDATIFKQYINPEVFLEDDTNFRPVLRYARKTNFFLPHTLKRLDEENLDHSYYQSRTLKTSPWKTPHFQVMLHKLHGRWNDAKDPDCEEEGDIGDTLSKSPSSSSLRSESNSTDSSGSNSSAQTLLRVHPKSNPRREKQRSATQVSRQNSNSKNNKTEESEEDNEDNSEILESSPRDIDEDFFRGFGKDIQKECLNDYRRGSDTGIESDEAANGIPLSDVNDHGAEQEKDILMNLSSGAGQVLEAHKSTAVEGSRQDEERNEEEKIDFTAMSHRELMKTIVKNRAEQPDFREQLKQWAEEEAACMAKDWERRCYERSKYDHSWLDG
jgi:hypothetical protein